MYLILWRRNSSVESRHHATHNTNNDACPRSVPAETTSSTSSTIPSPTSESLRNDSGNGLSTGAKAGIGVGVSVGFILLALAVLILVRRRNKQKQSQVTGMEINSQAAKEVGPGLPHELGSKQLPAELTSTT